MKLRVFLLTLMCTSLSSFGSDWKPAENTMLTVWGEKVTPEQLAKIHREAGIID